MRRKYLTPPPLGGWAESPLVFTEWTKRYISPRRCPEKQNRRPRRRPGLACARTLPPDTLVL